MQANTLTCQEYETHDYFRKEEDIKKAEKQLKYTSIYLH